MLPTPTPRWPIGRRLGVHRRGLPLDEQGAVVAAGDVAGQAEQVMANLRSALATAGAQLTDVVKTTVYVASAQRQDLVAAWEVVHRHFENHEAPSTLLGVAVLGYRDQLVEVEAVAALHEAPLHPICPWDPLVGAFESSCCPRSTPQDAPERLTPRHP